MSYAHRVCCCGGAAPGLACCSESAGSCGFKFRPGDLPGSSVIGSGAIQASGTATGIDVIGSGVGDCTGTGSFSSPSLPITVSDGELNISICRSSHSVSYLPPGYGSASSSFSVVHRFGSGVQLPELDPAGLAFFAEDAASGGEAHLVEIVGNATVFVSPWSLAPGGFACDPALSTILNIAVEAYYMPQSGAHVVGITGPGLSASGIAEVDYAGSFSLFPTGTCWHQLAVVATASGQYFDFVSSTRRLRYTASITMIASMDLAALIGPCSGTALAARALGGNPMRAPVQTSGCGCASSRLVTASEADLDAIDRAEAGLAPRPHTPALDPSRLRGAP